MSLPLAHFCLGATISLFLYRRISGLENYTANDIFVAIFGGILAMLPDFPKLLSPLEPMYSGIWCNLFFFHCWLDQLDPNDSPAVIIFLIIALLIVAFYGVQEEE